MYGTSKRSPPSLLEGLEALLDGILVRAGERRVDEVADVGVAGMHGQLVAVLGHAAQLVDVAQIQHWVDALGVHVERQGDDVDVAGALAVAEQGALDAVGAGHDPELGRCDAGAAVVVRVEAQDDVLAPRQVAVHPLDHVAVDVRRAHLDGRRQVDDDLVVDAGIDDVDHGVADALGEGQLGAGEGLGRILVAHLGVGDLALEFLAQRGAVGGDLA